MAQLSLRERLQPALLDRLIDDERLLTCYEFSFQRAELKRLGIPEPEFMRATKGTYKLGIDFIGWGAEGERYFHPFGQIGSSLDGVSFHQLWLKHRADPSIGPLAAYSLAGMAGLNNRFAPGVTGSIELASGETGTVVLSNGKRVTVTPTTRAETEQEVADGRRAMERPGRLDS